MSLKSLKYALRSTIISESIFLIYSVTHCCSIILLINHCNSMMLDYSFKALGCYTLGYLNFVKLSYHSLHLITPLHFLEIKILNSREHKLN